MGAKSSKQQQQQQYNAQLNQSTELFLQQINRDLERKRPLSRAIPELSLAKQHHDQDEDEDEDDEEDEGAIVYVFNPDRIVSKRVSKRVPSQLSSLSTAAASASNIPKHYTMVNSMALPFPGKSIDCCVLGRTGSGENSEQARATCQDEVHFEVSNDDMLCFGCFDGHGADGHVIAAACAAQLSSCVLDDQQYYLGQKDFPSAVRGGIESLVRRLQEISPNRADIEHSGATAVIGLVDAATCTVHLANVGDTRAIGARRVDNKYALVQLSQEHILSVEEEARRIEESGGAVHPLLIDGEFVGPPRCFFNHELATLPGLMVSRTLGDTVARSIGVVAEPDVFSADHLAFLVLASDGLWEVMTNEEVVQFVGQRLGLATRETALSQLLCVEAHKRWLALENQVGDDVSCLVLVFEQPAT